MKLVISRFIAVMLLVIPGLAATYGFLKMKDEIFAAVGPQSLSWPPFLLGFVLFALGVSFIGGWTFFRDRKRNYVAPRFRAKKRSARPRIRD